MSIRPPPPASFSQRDKQCSRSLKLPPYYWQAELRVSATTNYQGSDLLFVFSTSSVFEAGKAYSKFAAYAILEYGGDFSTAARTGCARGDKRGHGWRLRCCAVKVSQGIGSIHSSPLTFYSSLLAIPTTILLTFLSWWV